jgi:hypothetical protein
MSTSTLRKVLLAIENADSPLSTNLLARELGQPPDRVEEYVQYWVRRGRIQETGSSTACSGCGIKGECPFVISLPKSYQAVNKNASSPILNQPCGQDDCGVQDQSGKQNERAR